MGAARVLLTGSSGLLGRRTLERLRTQGVDVVAVSRRPTAGVDLAVDLLDPAALDACVRTVRPTIVLHLAWATSHGSFWTDPANVAWTEATLRLAMRAEEMGASAFVGVGTCAEQPGPLEPTLYGVAKTATRDVLATWAAKRPLRFAWARLFYVYAEDEPATKLIASAARALLAHQTFLARHPDDVLDFVHADDVAGALAVVATSSLAGVIDIGTGEGRRVADLLTALARLAKAGNVTCDVEPHQPPLQVVADTNPLRTIGWSPRVGLEDGLRRVLAYA
jgi:nucleoside-diphosphate-sugar epimerase